MLRSGVTITPTSELVRSTRNSAQRGPPHISSLEWLAKAFLRMYCEFAYDLKLF